MESAYFYVFLKLNLHINKGEFSTDKDNIAILVQGSRK